jgi:excisionase family DNA binding protein
MAGTVRITVTDEHGVDSDAPEQVYRVAEEALSIVAEGRDATLVVVAHDLTTQEAADILGVSRPHLIKMLDAGEIAHYKVGTHRRVDVGDVIAYRRNRDALRRKALDGLAAESQDLGMY